jgi:hypothetical protein
MSEFQEVGGFDAVSDEVSQRAILHGELLAALVDSILPLRARLLSIQL